MIETPEALGARVAEARRAAGLTQEALAEAMGLERTALAKIERGSRGLAALELVRMAEVLDLPLDWFLEESPPSILSRRMDRSTADGLTTAADRLTDRLARAVRFLDDEGFVELAGRPSLDLPRDFVRAEDAARAVHRLAGSDMSRPLLDLASFAERLGLLAFSFNLGPSAPDGSFVALANGGVALVNGSLESGRRRYTLAHEIGHFVFDDQYSDDWLAGNPSETERMINAFAAHLLMPRVGVAGDWDTLGGEANAGTAVVVLAGWYRVSVSAMAGQLANLRLVDRDRVRELAECRATSAIRREYGLVPHTELAPPSLPGGYVEAVRSAYAASRVSLGRARELLFDASEHVDLRAPVRLPLDALLEDIE